MKIEGTRHSGIVKLDGKVLSLTKSLKYRNHSPTGFAWGYGGSGPSQLALAILIEKLDIDEALKYYQQFKWDHVANWGQSDFDVEINLNNWLEQVKLKAFYQNRGT